MERQPRKSTNYLMVRHAQLIYWPKLRFSSILFYLHFKDIIRGKPSNHKSISLYYINWIPASPLFSS